MRARTVIHAAAAALFVVCAGCMIGRPTPGAVVTFVVADEVFRVWLTAPDQVDAAQRARASAIARVPIGRIVDGTEFNVGWSWHLEDVTFDSASIEACDGRPSEVEQHGTAFGGGQYCPRSATIVRIDRIPR